MGSVDCRFPNGATVLFSTDKVHNENVASLFDEKSSVRPSGAHDSGTCDTTDSAFVRRTAGLEPSARCMKMPRSPSRSDWKATKRLSPDQTGNRLCPSPANVSR